MQSSHDQSKLRSNRLVRFATIARAGFCALVALQGTFADDTLESMSLDDLMKQRAALHEDSTTASGTDEALRDAPASMIVLDAQTLQRRGYDSLDDILSGLPGFDTITTNGTLQTIAYQRGYRTPWTQRTLFLINGKVDNNLWNHTAQFSRQYPVNMIERVEVLHGPAGAVYGPNAFLGVINVITRDSSRLEDGETFAEASLIAGDFDSRSVDLAVGGRQGVFSFDFGAKWFVSDEPGIDDYSSWGFTDESLLSDPVRWGPGIGDGIDPATGAASPPGDIDVDGVVEANERINGNALGSYSDPTDDYGYMGEVRFGDWELGVIGWKTEEGYGPYYSFADAQPGTPWIHESNQAYLNHHFLANEAVAVKTELVLRSSAVGGNWAESFADFISLSTFQTNDKAWRIEQTYTYDPGDNLQISGGLKYEEKDLTKVYMITNYWDGGGVSLAQGPTSSTGYSSDGSGIRAVDDISSENPTPFFPPAEASIPAFNLNRTEDVGAYVQGIWDSGPWRINAGLRHDHNSDYHSVTNPRGAIVYHQNPRTSYKLVYGEAFQEPSPKDLFGGWNGRASNPDLEPERARNLEAIATFQGERIMHDASIYIADYRNAIAGGQNVGGREVFGFEYRGSFRASNPISNSSDITGSLYYTYTDSQSERQYNNETGIWDLRKDETGDIAPHKVNLTLNAPIGRFWNANVMANWISERNLFSENPLRADSNPNRTVNRKAEAYTKVDLNIKFETDRYRLSLKVENLFEEDYLLPGPEGASSGDDFSDDFDGFQNSLLPQVNTRAITFSATLKL